MSEMYQDKPIIITATMLRWASMCERRIWLDCYGDSSQRSEVSTIVAFSLNEGIEHEREVHAATAPNAIPFAVKNWADGVKQTRTLMDQGARLILGACLELQMQLKGIDQSIILRGKVDRLERSSKPMVTAIRDHRWVYRPIEIKVYPSVDDADVIQLDLYTFIVGHLQQVMPRGEFWLGRGEDGRPKEKLPHTFDQERLFNTLSETAHHLSSAKDEPNVVLKKVCGRCIWRSSCRTIAENNHDVHVLPGLRADTRQHFKTLGITTLDQLIAMEPHQLQQFKGIKTTAEGVHASARAWLNKSAIWYRTVPESIRAGGWMFDIETIMPENKEVWCIGWCDGHQAVQTIIVDSEVYFNDDESYLPYRLSNGETVLVVPDADAAWRVFASNVDDGRPIFHWGAFDNTVMRNYAPDDARSRLDGRLRNLCQIFDSVVKCPIENSSLKTVAPYLGFQWNDYQDAISAFVDYKKWLKNTDKEALSRACSYSNDDVRALFIVWKWLVGNAPDQIE